MEEVAAYDHVNFAFGEDGGLGRVGTHCDMFVLCLTGRADVLAFCGGKSRSVG